MRADSIRQSAPRIVVMGVSGCGKSTIGEALGQLLGLPFADADDFHSAANIAKMTGGTSLTDVNRWPWLDAVGQWLGEHDSGAVVACSALRSTYRDRIRTHCPDAYFVHLAGPIVLAVRRVGARRDHYMPSTLVGSQYDTLEALHDEESGTTISFDQPRDAVLEELLVVLNGGARP
ncbi:gluconokinase [Cumulibacter soli]|uniref:gluconokinase n=1 Tax=Cumulibacter soli TaxID=2546344 RepID=UPI001ABADB6C|nr:gluconokinase [Cumulibacter soli]